MSNGTMSGSRKSSNKNWIIRSINGVPFPRVPRAVEHQLFVVDRDSYEDLDGNLQRTVLGEKDKFIINFPMMYSADLQTILQQVQSASFTVVYEDFWNKSILRTGKFYRGDVAKSPFWIKDDDTLYEEQSISLIAYNVRKVNR